MCLRHAVLCITQSKLCKTGERGCLTYTTPVTLNINSLCLLRNKRPFAEYLCYKVNFPYIQIKFADVIPIVF